MKKHTFRKKWGQNFLQDPNIIHKIVDQIKPTITDHIIEIGPGQGALTSALANQCKQVTAIEIDPLLIQPLEKCVPENVDVIECDILEINLHKYDHAKIIGNLPYNITSPILFKCLQLPYWERLVFMVQKEVAERITAVPGNKIYGRLSVMAQTFADVSLNFTVPKTVFVPTPKIDSAVITFKRNSFKIDDLDKFSLLVKTAFSQRRKTLRNNLRSAYPQLDLGDLSSQRAETLSVQEFIDLSEYI